MAIDTKTLSELIAEFRLIQTKNGISPDSLGYLLQRITDLLATAGTSETVERLQTLLDGFRGAGSAYTLIEPLSQDRNNILANVSKVNLITGAVSTEQVEFIHQATTERAGAMRAQQVTDLNAARNNVATLQKQMTTVLATLEQLQAEIGNGGGGSGGTVVTTASNLGTISCEVVEGQLLLRGFSKYKAAGYVPYVFRFTRKRNIYKHQNRPENKQFTKYCKATNGWHLYGSYYAVEVRGDVVRFSTNSHKHLKEPSASFSELPDAIIHVHTDKRGKRWIPWGRSMVEMHDRTGKPRMLRFRFGIGFGKKIEPNIVKLTPANLVSNLAEFSIIYDPEADQFTFSR